MVDEQEVNLRLFDLEMKKALFVCVHNSGRSQMAEAFFIRLTKGDLQVDIQG
jgi:protein-tyrosine-phosphatase